MEYQIIGNPEYGKQYVYNDMRLVGDTVIQDIPFMQIYVREYKNEVEKPTEWHPTNKYLGQEEEKIYLYSATTRIMWLDMNMALKAGDVISCYDATAGDLPLPYRLKVTAESDTLLNSVRNGELRKCIHVQVESYPLVSDIWIEGIGSVNYGITGVGNIMATGSIPRLLKVMDGDNVIYQPSDDTSASVSSTPSAPIDYSPKGIFDLKGRRLTIKPKHGIYIKNRQKCIVNADN